MNAARVQLWSAHIGGQVDVERQLAAKLLAQSPDDPLAAATMLMNNPMNDKDSFELAQRALARYSDLRNPGVGATTFYSMQRFMASTLSAAVGLGYSERKQFEAARPFLQRAVEVEPDNGRFAYALATAYLSGSNPDAKQGYWYMARAVSLTRGSPPGEQIAQYARSRYLQDGGTSENWDRFLVAAGTPAASWPQPDHASTSTVASATVPAAPQRTEPAAPRAQVPAITDDVSSKDAQPEDANDRTKKSADNAQQPNVEDTKNKRAPRQDERSDEEKLAALKERIERPAIPDEPARPTEVAPKPPVQSGAPVSIGVLIQSQMTEGSDRKAVINGLSDMVRHLRRSDEAFVLSFGSDMVMEEDLTANSSLLEKAMDDIDGSSGTALYDAVSFSAGHLARIARNRNRALLVISDGSVQTSRVSPFQLSRDIEHSGVRVYCIGMQVASDADQQRLMALATNTGGQAMFVSSAEQFRAAAQSIALRLGVPF